MEYILIADDNKDITDILEKYVKKEGYGALIATDGIQTEELFHTYHPAAILLDVMMPGMDGLEEARCIRALERSDAKTVPIIAVTANLFQQDISACSNAGMTGFLSKPLNVEQLLTMISQQTRKGEQRHE